MINLPRQAWDKHRESTQERDAFSQANATYFALADFQRSGGGGSSSYIAREGGGGEPEPETADGQAAAAAAGAAAAASASGGAAAAGGGGAVVADADATVEALLERLGLSQYAEAFAEEEFSLEILRESVRTYCELHND